MYEHIRNEEANFGCKIASQNNIIVGFCPSLNFFMLKVYWNKGNNPMTNAYRICITKIENCNEIMLVVQVHVGRHQL